MKIDIVVGKDYFEWLFIYEELSTLEGNIYLDNLKIRNLIYSEDFLNGLGRNFIGTEYEDLYFKLYDKLVFEGVYGENVIIDKSQTINLSDEYENEIFLLLNESKDRILISDLSEGIENINSELNIKRITTDDFENGNALVDYTLPKRYLINQNEDINIHFDFMKKFFMDTKEIEIRDGYLAKQEGKDVLVNKILNILPIGINMKLYVHSIHATDLEIQDLKRLILSTGKVNSLEVYGTTLREMHDREILITNRSRKDKIYLMDLGRGLSCFAGNYLGKSKYRSYINLNKHTVSTGPIYVEKIYN